MEIERKFRLANAPDFSWLRARQEEVLQGYILAETGELRIRRKGARNYLTVKGDGTISREEWETEVPAWVFAQLWPATEGRHIRKTRYTIRSREYTIEVDVYLDHLEGLVTMECEFPGEVAARRFRLPSWAAGAIEVTEDKAYKNKALATRGMPRT